MDTGPGPPSGSDSCHCPPQASLQGRKKSTGHFLKIGYTCRALLTLGQWTAIEFSSSDFLVLIQGGFCFLCRMNNDLCRRHVILEDLIATTAIWVHKRPTAQLAVPERCALPATDSLTGAGGSEHWFLPGLLFTSTHFSGLSLGREEKRRHENMRRRTTSWSYWCSSWHPWSETPRSRLQEGLCSFPCWWRVSPWEGSKPPQLLHISVLLGIGEMG